MNEQQLAAVKQALEAINNELAVDMTDMDAVDKTAEMLCKASTALQAIIDEQALAQPADETVANASAWFALVMNATAELEDASHCLRDEDAKRTAISGAKHYRDAANALYTRPQQALAQTKAELSNLERHEQNVRNFLGEPKAEQEPVMRSLVECVMSAREVFSAIKGESQFCSECRAFERADEWWQEWHGGDIDYITAPKGDTP